MTLLSNLKNTHRKSKSRMRVGRGCGSGKGKTSGRGHKGAKARSGYKRPYGREGGQMPLHMKLPKRGFSNARFRKELDAINLGLIETLFNDGDVVNEATLRERGYISGSCHGVKILGKGELKKKVTIEAHAISAGAQEKLKKAKISFTQVERKKKIQKKKVKSKK